MNIQGNIKKQRNILKYINKKRKENPLNGIQMVVKVDRSIELQKKDWILFSDGSIMRINNRTYPILQKNPDPKYRSWLTGLVTMKGQHHPSVYGTFISVGWIDGIEVQIWRRLKTAEV